jgi:hypothetical protein
MNIAIVTALTSTIAATTEPTTILSPVLLREICENITQFRSCNHCIICSRTPSAINQGKLLTGGLLSTATTTPGVKYRGSSSGVGTSVMPRATMKISTQKGPRRCLRRHTAVQAATAYTGLNNSLRYHTEPHDEMH